MYVSLCPLQLGSSCRYLGMEGVHGEGNTPAFRRLLQLSPELSDLSLVPQNEGALIQDLIALGMDFDLHRAGV